MFRARLRLRGHSKIKRTYPFASRSRMIQQGLTMSLGRHWQQPIAVEQPAAMSKAVFVHRRSGVVAEEVRATKLWTVRPMPAVP
jgi:hypothetical protein